MRHARNAHARTSPHLIEGIRHTNLVYRCARRRNTRIAKRIGCKCIELSFRTARFLEHVFTPYHQHPAITQSPSKSHDQPAFPANAQSAHCPLRSVEDLASVIRQRGSNPLSYGPKNGRLHWLVFSQHSTLKSYFAIALASRIRQFRLPHKPRPIKATTFRLLFFRFLETVLSCSVS